MNTVRFAPESTPEGLMISPVHKIPQAQGDIEAGAILPDVGKRRLATDADLEGLWATEDTPPSALVEVFSTPPDILEAITRVEERLVARDALVRVIAAHGGEYLFMRRSPPHALTTTVYLDKPVIPGMHVDNRDKQPLATRSASRRRMGINFGPGDRSLLMCVPDIMEVAHKLGRANDCVPGNAELHEFIDADPSKMQCIWVPIRPGEMYISPSDLSPHDGSAWDAPEGSDMHFALGQWGRNEFAGAP